MVVDEVDMYAFQSMHSRDCSQVLIVIISYFQKCMSVIENYDYLTEVLYPLSVFSSYISNFIS